MRKEMLLWMTWWIKIKADRRQRLLKTILGMLSSTLGPINSTSMSLLFQKQQEDRHQFILQYNLQRFRFPTGNASNLIPSGITTIHLNALMGNVRCNQST